MPCGVAALRKIERGQSVLRPQHSYDVRILEEERIIFGVEKVRPTKALYAIWEPEGDLGAGRVLERRNLCRLQEVVSYQDQLGCLLPRRSHNLARLTAPEHRH